MDLQMPIMGGIESLNLLRERGYTSPVVILTANVIQNEEVESHEFDCQGFLSKPIEEDKFNQVIQSFLQVDKSKTHVSNDRLENTNTDNSNSDAIISKLVTRKSGRFQKVAKMFALQLNDKIVEIETAFNSDEKEHLEDLIHVMKGLGGNMGYDIISDISKCIEDSLINVDHDGIKKGIQELYEA